MRPFAGPRPLILVLPTVVTVVLLVLAARIAMSRDVGEGLIPTSDMAQPSLRLLSSPTALALRRQRGVLAAWIIGLGSFAVILGAISTSVSTAGISASMQKDLARFGVGSILSPIGYLSFVFIVFIFAVCLFSCAQVGAAREEESSERLETVLVQPVSRYGWLGGRLALAAVIMAALSLLAGLMTWVGARSQGVGVSLPKLLEAGVNCLPPALMFLGLAALAYALLPRASSTISYTLVGLSFLWYLVGDLLGAPRWLTDLTPFQHIGLVPVQNLEVPAAGVMLGIGLAAAVAALVLFRRRDLAGA